VKYWVFVCERGVGGGGGGGDVGIALNGAVIIIFS